MENVRIYIRHVYEFNSRPVARAGRGGGCMFLSGVGDCQFFCGRARHFVCVFVYFDLQPCG